MKKIKFLFVFMPLFIGIMIYLLYRSRNLFYFNLINFLNINGYVLLARDAAILYRKLFPTWVIYSLPDGLWLFSTGAMILLCRYRFFVHFIWFTFVYAVVIGGEFFQKYYGGHGTPVGTFDKNDIIAFNYAYVSICVIAIILNLFDKKHFKSSLKFELAQDLIYTFAFAFLGILANML